MTFATAALLIAEAAPPKLEDVAKAVADNTSAVNLVWTLVAGFLVMFMQAGFAMVETGRPVREVVAHFRKQNVLIGRPFPPMVQYVRVSFGRPAEMDAFWKAWDILPNMARQ